jgi:small subunit ribosomal protein S15
MERSLIVVHVRCRARYRGVGTDLSKVDQFKRHTADVGSTEVQIARISARVLQLTAHLKEHRKDFAATRGLVILLGQRRRLLTYLYKHNR